MSLTYTQGHAIVRIADALEVLASQAALPYANSQVQRYTYGGSWDAPEPSDAEIQRLKEAEDHRDALLSLLQGFQPA